MDGGLLHGSPIGVEGDGTDGLPVARVAAPASPVSLPSSCVDASALGEDGLVAAVVTVIGGDVAQGAVQVLVVVPADEALDPSAGLGQGGEGPPRC